MVDGVENPYSAAHLAESLFVGRELLLADLCGAVRSGRSSVRAVMGGRGMGKSSLARRLEARLAPDALVVVASGTAPEVTAEICRVLDVDLTGGLAGALAGAVKQCPRARAAIIIDEVERVLKSPGGDVLFDNLRRAYERAERRLALIVLGGTAVRDLLEDEASPFLRIMGSGIHTLQGLTRDEAAELLRAPLTLDIPDEMVDAPWMETAGHPWLLQMFMEYAVEAASSKGDVVGHIPAALRKAEQRLDDAGFRTWWGNMREKGQDVYRRLVRQPSAVSRVDWVRCFGADPRPWLHVLESTGVALVTEDAVIARGTLFRRWVELNHPETRPELARAQDGVGSWLTGVGADDFERLVVRALAAWARATIEFPAAALKPDAHVHAGNKGLSPEAFFQMHAIVALLQHERDLTAEPEAVSMTRAGRSDIKVRSRHDTTRRACVEFKIFGRDDDDVVRQVIRYAALGDTFAAVVSVDRCQRPLRRAFEDGCFEGAAPEATHDAPAGVLYPAFFTTHAREGGEPIRVWHFLVQLRDT
jgi:hypothetical protein